MGNYVVQKLDALRKNCEDLVKERKEVIATLAEYGWVLSDEQMLVTCFARVNNNEPETVFINYIQEDKDWKLFTTGGLENGELLTFSNYIDIRRMLDNM